MGPMYRPCQRCGATLYLESGIYCKKCERQRKAPTVNDLRKRIELLDLERELDELEAAIREYY